MRASSRYGSKEAGFKSKVFGGRGEDDKEREGLGRRWERQKKRLRDGHIKILRKSEGMGWGGYGG